MKKLLALLSAVLLLAVTPAWATFPTIQATAVTTADASTTSPASVNLPASLASGDLIIVFFGCSCTTITTPTNWTQLVKVNAGASDAAQAIYFKTADGTEGATVSITFTGTVKYAAVSYRITGWTGTPNAATLTSAANSTTPDPPSVTATGGSADNLFIAAAESASTAGLTTAPTNYGSGLNAASTTTGTVASQSTAFRNLTSATDDPGTFTLSATGHTVATTVVIAPAVAVPAHGLLTLGVGG